MTSSEGDPRLGFDPGQAEKDAGPPHEPPGGASAPEMLFSRLQALDIQFTTQRHPAVFTVEQARALRGPLPGRHCKNLFLRNKKGRMWLVVSLESRTLDLKALGAELGAGHLSFGSPRRLMDHLGVLPGAVTPFGVVNDPEGRVQVVLDRALLEEGPLNFHPLTNEMTTSIGVEDFLRFLRAEGHPPRVVDFGSVGA